MMIPVVQFPLALSIIVLQVSIATGQIGLKNNPDAVNFLDGGGLSNNTITKEHFTGLREDRQVNYKLAVPFMSLSPTTLSFSGDSYWMGSVTTQSYNRGKIGRYYYWDMLGNLQGSHLFLDVAGKGKRGLKLVFPRQRTFF